MPRKATYDAQFMAQQWHDGRAESRADQPPETAACLASSCFCCCTDCDPDFEPPEPNPYFDDAMAAMTATAEDVHGRIGTYNKGCRCDPCREANNDRVARQPTTRQRLRAKPRPTAEIPHGMTGYDYHDCRCDICRTAYARRYADAQQQTIAGAIHKRAPWSPDELTIARDRSITAVQAALTLGRTLAAVKAVRASRSAVADKVS